MFFLGKVLTKEYFTLFQPNIIDILKTKGKVVNNQNYTSQEFFLTSIGLEFEKIAKRFGCGIILNPNKVKAAHKCWVADITGQRISGGGVPDQYKHSGLLAYWLRRKQIVESCEPTITYDADYSKNHQNEFLKAPSEMLSFILCFNLAAYYTYPRYKTPTYSLEAFMRDSRATDQYLYDAAHYLENKHVSPHSLYLIYRAFFETPLRFRNGIPAHS